MKLKDIPFNDSASKRVYQNYMRRIKRTIKPLPPKDQQEILLEFNSHIYEGLKRKDQQNEIDRLLDVLDHLGEPEEVLKPLVADKTLEQATSTFNPVHLTRALILNVSNGVSYVFFILLYLSLFGFVFLIYAKLTQPNQVGLYFKGGSFKVLGKINPEYLQATPHHEVLGSWFIPIMLLAIIVCYFLITLLLKLKRIINQN